MSVSVKKPERSWRWATLAVVLLVLNLTSLPDQIATDYLDDALLASATAYVAARGINGTISVIQDIEFSIGVMSGSPGEVLDPLNDLIERFSTVILFATASLGIQKIMLSISGWPVLQWLLGVMLLLLAARPLCLDRIPSAINDNIGLVYKILILFLALRFAVPLMAIAGGAVESIFISDEMERNVAMLQEVNESTEELSELITKAEEESERADAQVNAGSETDEGVWGYLKEGTNFLISSVALAAARLNLKRIVEEKVDELGRQLSASIASTINLISLFIMQSIVLPLMFLYAILFGAKRLFRHEFVG